MQNVCTALQQMEYFTMYKHCANHWSRYFWQYICSFQQLIMISYGHLAHHIHNLNYCSSQVICTTTYIYPHICICKQSYREVCFHISSLAGTCTSPATTRWFAPKKEPVVCILSKRCKRSSSPNTPSQWLPSSAQSSQKSSETTSSPSDIEMKPFFSKAVGYGTFYLGESNLSFILSAGLSWTLTLFYIGQI